MRQIKTVSWLLSLTLILTSHAAFAQREDLRSGKTTTGSSTRGNVEAIRAERMKEQLSFIASDEFEGRDTPSRGLDTAARFIAMNLALWGVKPAGDGGTYFQRIELSRRKIDAASTRVEFGGRGFAHGEDFLAFTNEGNVTGQLVYASHGWVIKDKNIDAYRGLNVKAKIVITHNHLPQNISYADLKGKEGVDWLSPTHYARTHGAKGIIIIPGFPTQAGWNQNLYNLTQTGTVVVKKFQAEGDKGLPTIFASMRLLDEIFKGEKVDAATVYNRGTVNDYAEPFEFNPAKRVALRIAVTEEAVFTQNVVGVVEGSDPMLKNEYVAIGAHYDHVGKSLPDSMTRFPAKDAGTNDTIYNGADDNASGTVAVLAMAEAFAKGPRPKRSILFVWHTGEEKGLWGSRYFVENPTIPLRQIITALNIDMIGRSKKPGDANPANQNLVRPREIFLIGSKMMSSELGALSEAVNSSYLNLSFNYKFDDPNDPNYFFYRSDHFNYARKGIPIIFYMDGEHEDYHRPSDEIASIDFQQMEMVARTIYATAWELANVKNRPRVDRKLPFTLD